MASISVIIPVYNGADSLGELHQRLVRTLSQITADFEIIMVDDNSKDGSYEQILKLHKQDQRVKAVRLLKNFGQQNVIICGLNLARGDYVVTLDDDLQHKPEDIIRLYQTIIKGYDVVYAIPADREYGFYRKLGSKLTNFLFAVITPKAPKIRVSSFRIMSRKLVEKLVQHKASFVYISAIILKETDNIANIYVRHQERKYGHSNYNLFKLLRLFLKLLIYHGNLPLWQLFRAKTPQYIIAEKLGFDSTPRENCSVKGDWQ